MSEAQKLADTYATADNEWRRLLSRDVVPIGLARTVREARQRSRRMLDIMLSPSKDA